MVQTYQGYFTEDGRFIPNGTPVKLPTRRRAIVNILDEDIEDMANADASKSDSDAQDRVERIEMILAAALEAKDELTDEDWDEMLNLRAKTNAGLSRTVEI